MKSRIQEVLRCNDVACVICGFALCFCYSGDVDDVINIPKYSVEGGRVQKIASYNFHTKIVKFFQILVMLANEAPDFESAFCQRFNSMSADKSGSAGDKNSLNSDLSL